VGAAKPMRGRQHPAHTLHTHCTGMPVDSCTPWVETLPPPPARTGGYTLLACSCTSPCPHVTPGASHLTTHQLPAACQHMAIAAPSTPTAHSWPQASREGEQNRQHNQDAPPAPGERGDCNKQGCHMCRMPGKKPQPWLLSTATHCTRPLLQATPVALHSSSLLNHITPRGWPPHSSSHRGRLLLKGSVPFWWNTERCKSSSHLHYLRATHQL
jgi:hypothetical protein